MTDSPLYDLVVDPRLGRVHILKQRWEEHFKYSFVIYPTKDLVLDRELGVIFLVPFDFHIRAEVRVKLVKLDPHLRSQLDCHGVVMSTDSEGTMEISMPWLTNNKYPLGVWFHSVRNMFRNESIPRWATPLQLESSLGDSSAQYLPLSTRVDLVSGVGKNKGRRPYMEDVSFAFDFIRTKGDKGVAVYGVLDGHGGGECALYVADELPAKIAASLRLGQEVPEALFNSFLKVDEEFLGYGDNPSGSTASVIVWDGYRLKASVGNTGDTRTILSRLGRAVDLTMDRKATDHDEISRISRSGGFVGNGRVMGSLAVSRAFGDRRLKEMDPKKKILIVDPDVSSVQIIPNEDEFIVIATDGLWDVMSSQDAVDFVKQQLLERGIDISTKSNLSANELSTILSEIADLLVKRAIFELSSGDNVTAMIISLQNCCNTTLVPDPNFIATKVEASQPSSNASFDFDDLNLSTLGTSPSSSVFRNDNVAPAYSRSNSSAVPISRNSSTAKQATSAPSASAPAAADNDKDLMDFLLDDSNF